MKNFVMIAAIAVVGLAGGYAVRDTLVSDTPTIDSAYIENLSDFQWGVTLLTYPFPRFDEEFIATQLEEAKQLGINSVRIDYIPKHPESIDRAVNEARARNLKVVLVIPFGPKDIFTDKQLTTNTDNYVTDIVKRYAGNVAVYQLANEIASVALGNNGALHGINLKDYPADKLNAVTTWTKTAAIAVKKTDPKAKTLINDQWVHTGFFDHYIASGGEFDILGWNWFSDMGESLDTVTLDKAKNQKYQLLGKLKSYNKPIWLTEVNRRLGSQSNKEQEQADYIKTMADYTKSTPTIRGFFVFNFLDDQGAPPQEKGYGIITAEDRNGEQKITGRKPAYEIFQKAITE
jgi:hypothetical protein